MDQNGVFVAQSRNVSPSVNEYSLFVADIYCRIKGKEGDQTAKCWKLPLVAEKNGKISGAKAKITFIQKIGRAFADVTKTSVFVADVTYEGRVSALTVKGGADIPKRKKRGYSGADHAVVFR